MCKCVNLCVWLQPVQVTRNFSVESWSSVIIQLEISFLLSALHKGWLLRIRIIWVSRRHHVLGHPWISKTSRKTIFIEKEQDENIFNCIIDWNNWHQDLIHGKTNDSVRLDLSQRLTTLWLNCQMSSMWLLDNKIDIFVLPYRLFSPTVRPRYKCGYPFTNVQLNSVPIQATWNLIWSNLLF